MAYADTTNTQKRQLADLSTNDGVALGNATTNGGAGSGDTSSQVTAQANGGTQFVNFGDYISANQPATSQYASTIGSQIGIPGAQGAVDAAKTAGQQAISSGVGAVDQGTLQKVLANPNDDSLKSTAGYQNLTAILGGKGYTGPTDAASLLTPAQTQIQQVQNKASLLNDASGLQTLFQQNPNPGTTPGGAALDAALVLGTPGSQAQIAQVQKQAADLGGAIPQAQADLQAKIAAAQQQAGQQRQGLVDAANTARSQLEGTVQQQLTQQQATQTAQQTALTNSLKQGDLSVLKQILPNFDDSQLAPLIAKATTGGPQPGMSYIPERMPVATRPDLSPYVTVKPGNLTTGNAATADQQARYQGLTSLFGLNNDNFLQAAGNPNSVEFAALQAIHALTPGATTTAPAATTQASTTSGQTSIVPAVGTALTGAALAAGGDNYNNAGAMNGQGPTYTGTPADNFGAAGTPVTTGGSTSGTGGAIDNTGSFGDVGGGGTGNTAPADTGALPTSGDAGGPAVGIQMPSTSSLIRAIATPSPLSIGGALLSTYLNTRDANAAANAANRDTNANTNGAVTNAPTATPGTAGTGGVAAKAAADAAQEVIAAGGTPEQAAAAAQAAANAVITPVQPAQSFPVAPQSPDVSTALPDSTAPLTPTGQEQVPTVPDVAQLSPEAQSMLDYLNSDQYSQQHQWDASGNMTAGSGPDLGYTYADSGTGSTATAPVSTNPADYSNVPSAIPNGPMQSNDAGSTPTADAGFLADMAPNGGAGWGDDGLTGAPTPYKTGGLVRGPGTGTSDSIDARLSNGEYVIPSDVVRRLGTKFFEDLVAQHSTRGVNTTETGGK